MSRLLLLAGTPPLPALEARSSSYTSYQGCYSLDTTTAASVYNLDQSDPPTCAATCGDEYPYTAILAQFCFCFPSRPGQATAYNDSTCSINCDMPYQDESCGGITPGSLIDLYSYYAVSDLDVPYGGGDGGSSATYSPGTFAIEPTVAGLPTQTSGTGGDNPGSLDTGTTSAAINGPTIAGSGVSGATTDSAIPTSDADVGQPAPSDESAPTPASVPDISATHAGDVPTDAATTPETVTTVVISTYTVTLWTTVTSYTTVYPGGPLQSTLVSSPTATVSFPAQLFTSSHAEVTITVPCDEDGAVTTSVLPGSIQVVAYNPWESEVREVLETQGTKVVLAAVVVARTANIGSPYGGGWGAAGNGSANGMSGSDVPLATGLGQSASVTGGLGFNGSVNSATQFPVTAGAGRGAPSLLNYFVAVVMLGAAMGAVCGLWYHVVLIRVELEAQAQALDML